MSEIMKLFGELVFNRDIMRTKLSKNAYTQLMDTIEREAPLDKDIAEEIAHSMKEWAIDQGATHFTHWFQPLREGTAEKHYAFINYNEEGELIERLSAKQLIQSEPDASSFPSGGIRSTFEARGYTAWDPTSPVFLIEGRKGKTLVIPSVFMSWTGDVLDQKTALLRSKKALNNIGIKLQKLLGNRNAKRIQVWLGVEQEYFLTRKELYSKRPDMQTCGKTLFGARPARGQQMKDHYFGSIKKHILEFMEDFDRELYRRGIPAKTRHNEVSPNQFEVAPLYEEMNLAVDHNLQMMELIKDVAGRHNLVALLHERPYEGVNSSGKHLNWSIGDNTGVNYLEPSASPLRNITLLMTVVAVMLGIKKYGGLLRASVASASNDERLGTNEAPPNIMSVYLGSYLSDLLDEIESMSKLTEKKMAQISLGVRQLPSVVKDYSDRNRTAPIAFTGNKFEFRLVGSAQNPSEALTVFNLMVAYGYQIIYNELNNMKGDAKANALLVIKSLLKEARDAHFEGNSYAEEWAKEAKKRGLPCIKNTTEALPFMLNKQQMSLYTKQGVLTEKEINARYTIKLLKYIRTKEMELRTACLIARSYVLPALLKHMQLLGAAAKAVNTSNHKSTTIEHDIKHCETLYDGIHNMIHQIYKRLDSNNDNSDLLDIASAYTTKGAEDLAKLRHYVDESEKIVAKEYWPLASYQELFSSL